MIAERRRGRTGLKLLREALDVAPGARQRDDLNAEIRRIRGPRSRHVNTWKPPETSTAEAFVMIH